MINDHAAEDGNDDGAEAQDDVQPGEEQQHVENGPEEPPMCVICQPGMFRGEDVTALECGHALHTACLERWQQVSGSTVFVCAQGCHRSREAMQRRREMLLRGVERANPPAQPANPPPEAANPPAKVVAVVDPVVDNFVEELSEAMGNHILVDDDK